MQHPIPDQTIHFLTTRDGVKLAYALAGRGAPLVKAPNWLSHLEFEWQSQFCNPQNCSKVAAKPPGLHMA